MEGVGLGLARNIVQRYALETGSEQGFGIDEKVAHAAASMEAGLASLAQPGAIEASHPPPSARKEAIAARAAAAFD